jgi:hypothetical protein
MREAIDQVRRERHGSFLSVRVRSWVFRRLRSRYRAGLVGDRSQDRDADQRAGRDVAVDFVVA